MGEIFTTICLAGAIQALFLSMVLAIRKNNRRANRYLSLYLAFVALDALEIYLGARGLVSFARPYQLSIIPYSLVFGPSMFLYIALLTARINTFSKKYLLLYAPAIPAFVTNIVLFAVSDAHGLPRPVLYANMLINGGGLVYEAALYVLALLLLQKYISRLKDYFSAIDALKLSFIRAGLVVLIVSVPFIFLPLSHGHVRPRHEMLDAAAIVICEVLVFGMAFVAVLQPEIFNRIRIVESAVPPEQESSHPKYEKLRLGPSEEMQYAERLRECMTGKKPYLEEELTLQDLADELSLSTHHLSMILNIHFRQNFYTFVNSYRVEEVKQKFASPEYRDQNILSIAYSSGFNSKSTFNTMFKKITGKTPREYRADLSL